MSCEFSQVVVWFGLVWFGLVWFGLVWFMVFNATFTIFQLYCGVSFFGG